ncbi:MAG: Sec-independent protein translocase protein TatB [Acidimicrobiales bacterium]
MFNVGGMELLVIAVVALVVLGPDKLPGALRQFGTVVGELRRISQGFQTDLKGAIADAERDAARAADSAGPSSENHDPGAAQAVAQAELAAIEGVEDSAGESSADDDTTSS